MDGPILGAWDADPYFIETQAIENEIGPTSITRNILQDRTGRMWFASWEGIMSYDGTKFTNHMNRDGLRRYHTFCVLEDRDGVLWFGTIGAGLYRFDGESFQNFATWDGLANDRVGCILQDSKGVLWIGTQEGISCFDGESFRNYTALDGLLSGDVNAIVEDRAGRMWIGTRGDSYVLDGQTFTPITNGAGLTFQNIRTVIEDDAGNIWFGGNDGLWRFDGKEYKQFSKRFTGYLFQDRNGQIWASASTSNPIYVMSIYQVDVENAQADGEHYVTMLDLPGQVFGITQDAKGDLWFGTQNGALRFDGEFFHGLAD
ncbi:MAG: histidine kinase [Planctomycetes bacterium]|nr:histidine kinase [Planctomycetota bacterium]